MKHSDRLDVLREEKRDRAKEISGDLCSQSKWLTHGRSIKIDDLEDLGVKITDYGRDIELNDAITRYYTLLRTSFERSTIYKIFETVDSQIYRFVAPIRSTPQTQKSLIVGNSSNFRS